MGLSVHRAHGTRTRQFARFQGKLAKTDRIDARLLALYGHTPDLQLYRAPSPEKATLTALRRRHNPKLKAFAQALKARGKPNKLILTAIMRKLITILNAIVKSGQPVRA